MEHKLFLNSSVVKFLFISYAENILVDAMLIYCYHRQIFERCLTECVMRGFGKDLRFWYAWCTWNAYLITSRKVRFETSQYGAYLQSTARFSC